MRFRYHYSTAKLYIKSWFQKLTKGYADQETWNLDYSLAKWILPRLKYFRSNINSTSLNRQNNKSNYLTIQEWQDILDKIIYAFEFILKEDEILEKCYPSDFIYGFDFVNNELVPRDKRKPDYTYYDECLKKYSEGMENFKLYFRDLWD